MQNQKIAVIGKDRYFLRLKYFVMGYRVSLRPASQHKIPKPTRQPQSKWAVRYE